jgi:hypothetical protein
MKLNLSICIRLVLILYLYLLTEVNQTDAETQSEINGFERIVITGVGEGSFNLIDHLTPLRLLAWKKGNIYMYGKININVTKILEGNLHDPNFPSRPVGVANLEVVLINDAALGLKKFGEFKDIDGKWILTKLPDGSYIIGDIKNTPFQMNIDPEKKAIKDIAQGLRSGDPNQQYEALRRYKEIMSLSLIPDIIPLLDVTEKVTDPEAILMMTNKGYQAIPAEFALGTEARRVLYTAASPLRNSHSPQSSDSIKVWQNWWREILEIDPFPEIVVEPGKIDTLTTLPMNQTWPQPYLSPDGYFAVIGVSRYQYQQNQTRNGLRLLGINESSLIDDFVYKIPVNAINCEPTGLRMAWVNHIVGLVWKEYGYSEELSSIKFMVLDADNRIGHPVDLELKKINHMSLCSFNDSSGQWLLAFTTPAPGKNYEDRGLQDVFLLILDSGGNIIKKQPLALSIPPNYNYHDGIQALSVVATPVGPAIVYVNENNGLFLALLDWNLNTRKVTQVNDPEIRSNDFQPQLCYNDGILCVLWLQHESLFVRTVNIDGESLVEARMISESVSAIGKPVSFKNRFAFVWVDNSQTPNQVRLNTINSNGILGNIKTVYNGKYLTGPIDIGVSGNIARILIHSWAFYPHPLLIKEIALEE